jgi:hypothetical protein
VGEEMTDTPSESVPEPTFVFVGVVERLGASNVREAPRSDLTAVVSIEQVLLAPPDFADLSGEITVLLPADRPVEEHERRVFNCIGWILGSGVALRALDLTAPEEHEDAATAGARSGRDPGEAYLMQKLKHRVTASELIVSGFVTDVRSVQSESEGRPVSEHDPDWHEAVVQVDAVTKGDAPAEGVVVSFPLSRDIAWRDAPKFEVGQRGVWLLRSAPETEIPTEDAATFAARSYPVFTALDPLDFQPEGGEAARVDALVEPEPLEG